jgi:hypothetical protein
LATPLFYYSTHIIENQAESCLIFIVLGLLSWIVIKENEKTKGFYYLLTGFFIGLAFLTNFSSVILLLFGIMHIQLNGFLSLDYSNIARFMSSTWAEANNDFRKKVSHIVWLSIGCFLPVAFLGYYQYLLFSNPFKSVYSFLAELPHASSPLPLDYVMAFFSSFFQYMFSPNVGLFSFTPILFFPILVFILGMKHKKSPPNNLDAKNHQLRQSLFITMLIVQPLYIIFYTTFAAMHFARNDELISNYNLYSARHLLPIVFPLGFLLFDSITNLNRFSVKTKRALWLLLVLLWSFSLITNISATLIGDWIFGLDQIWKYIQTLADNGLWDVLRQGRWLIDW